MSKKKIKEIDSTSRNQSRLRRIDVYDKNDTSFFIDKTKALKLKDLDIELPKDEPTKIINLRLPTSLFNKIKAYASQQDVSYASLIKMLLSEGIDRKYLR